MTPTRLNPAEHAWLTDPVVNQVMEALSPGDSDQARFVGGCVRNALIGAPVDDIDIATQLEPEAAKTALEAAQIKVVPTGIDHGTLTAVAEGRPFEVTSLRKDVETFGRRAVVAFTQDWREDAGRRDFRLNAIYARRDGTLYDPFDGLADAQARQIVFIGDANARIAEDHLRILRFYRFVAWYADTVDPVGQAACAANAKTLNALSVERIWKELKKLLAAPDPTLALKAMQEGHVLTQLLPEAIDFNLLASIIKIDRGKSRVPDPLMRLAALLGRDADAMNALCERMKASNAEKSRAHAMSAPLSAFGLKALAPSSEPAELGAALYKIGAEGVEARLRLDEAQGFGDAEAALSAVDAFERPRFPVTGRDLLQAGFERGPALGVVLGRLETAWIESAFALTQADLIAIAREEQA